MAPCLPRRPWRGVVAGLAAVILLVTADAIAGTSRPSGLSSRRGYPRLAVLRTGFPPSDPAALEALHRNLGLSDLVVFPGNRGKWWALPPDAKGFTLRDYNRRMKILQYLSLDAFSTAPANGNEITPPPSDPDAALHARTFSRSQFQALARALGSPSFPWFDTVHPKWDNAIFKNGHRGRYAELACANWNSPVYRAYVKRAMAEVAAAGFDGMFFDFGAVGYLSYQNGHPTVMPPDCFRLSATGVWYWMSYPGERFEASGPPPSLESLHALDPTELDAIDSIEYCRTTSIPVEISSTEDAEAMILDFYADLRATSDLWIIWNGVHEESIQRNDVTLVYTHGGHQEGFGIRTLSPAQIRAQMDMVESFNARGKIFVGMIQAPAYDTAALLYGYAACMIAGGPNTFCEFSDQVPEDPLIQADPGKPQGRYVTLPEGVIDPERIVYKRVFAKVVVYLNATASPITVDALTIPARSALIEPR